MANKEWLNEWKKSTLSLTTTQAFNEQIECCMTSLEISNLSEQNQIKLPRVYSRPSLQSQTKLSELKIYATGHIWKEV